MQWLYNPDRSQVQIVKADGQVSAIPGRTKVYVDPSNMSADIGAKLSSRSLINKGGDPVSAVSVAPPASEEDLGISSDIHEDTVMVLPDLVITSGAKDLTIEGYPVSYEFEIVDELSEEDTSDADGSTEVFNDNSTNSGKRRKRKRR